MSKINNENTAVIEEFKSIINFKYICKVRIANIILGILSVIYFFIISENPSLFYNILLYMDLMLVVINVLLPHVKNSREKMESITKNYTNLLIKNGVPLNVESIENFNTVHIKEHLLDGQIFEILKNSSIIALIISFFGFAIKNIVDKRSVVGFLNIFFKGNYIFILMFFILLMLTLFKTNYEEKRIEFMLDKILDELKLEISRSESFIEFIDEYFNESEIIFVKEGILNKENKDLNKNEYGTTKLYIDKCDKYIDNKGLKFFTDSDLWEISSNENDKIILTVKDKYNLFYYYACNKFGYSKEKNKKNNNKESNVSKS